MNEDDIYGTIYHITNLQNGKVYIGQTVNSYHIRCRDHYSYLHNDNHYNEHLQNAFKKYGADSFITGSLCVAYSQDELDGWEDQYIDYYQSMDRSKGYNMKGGGNGGCHSEETKRKIGKALKGKAKSPESVRKMRESLTGFTHTKKTKKKMSISRTGKGNSMYGKTHSEETKRKISESQRNRLKNSGSTRMASNNPFYGKTHSEQTKQLMSAALKEYHRKKREVITTRDTQ